MPFDVGPPDMDIETPTYSMRNAADLLGVHISHCDCMWLKSRSSDGRNLTSWRQSKSRNCSGSAILCKF